MTCSVSMNDFGSTHPRVTSMLVHTPSRAFLEELTMSGQSNTWNSTFLRTTMMADANASPFGEPTGGGRWIVEEGAYPGCASGACSSHWTRTKADAGRWACFRRAGVLVLDQMMSQHQNVLGPGRKIRTRRDPAVTHIPLGDTRSDDVLLTYLRIWHCISPHCRISMISHGALSPLSPFCCLLKNRGIARAIRQFTPAFHLLPLPGDSTSISGIHQSFDDTDFPRTNHVRRHYWRCGSFAQPWQALEGALARMSWATGHSSSRR
jgi:hypothetical protein